MAILKERFGPEKKGGNRPTTPVALIIRPAGYNIEEYFAGIPLADNARIRPQLVIAGAFPFVYGLGLADVVSNCATPRA